MFPSDSIFLPHVFPCNPRARPDLYSPFRLAFRYCVRSVSTLTSLLPSSCSIFRTQTTGDFVKSGIITVDAGIKLLKQGYDVAAPVVEQGIRAVTPVVEQAFDAASPTLKAALPALQVGAECLESARKKAAKTITCPPLLLLS